MKNFWKKDISSRKDLSFFIAELEKNWGRISNIKEVRKRNKEIWKFRLAIKNLLYEYKRNNSNNNMSKSMTRELANWLNNHKI